MSFYLLYTYSIVFLTLLFSQYDSARIVEVNSGIVLSEKRDRRRLYIRRDDLIWGLIIFSLIVVLGMRGYFTYDSFNYERLFRTINSGSTIIHPEKSNFLFDWICRLVYLVGGTANLMFFVVALLTIFFLCRALRYIGVNRYLFIAFYLLSFQYYDLFNIVRQGLAIAIGFYCISKLIYKNENDLTTSWLEIIYLLCATLLHWSALVPLSLWIVLKIKKEFRIPLWLGISVLALSIAIAGYFATNSSLSSILSSIFGASWREGKYNIGLELGVREIGEGLLGIVVWLIFYFKGKTRTDNTLGSFAWLFFVSRFMTINFFILYRVNYYFYPLLFCAMLKTPDILESKWQKWLVMILYFLFYIVFFFFKIKGYTSFYGYYMVGIGELFR